MCKRNKEDGHWDAFTKWALECGINMDHEDDWGWAWWCWNAALNAREDAKTRRRDTLMNRLESKQVLFTFDEQSFASLEALTLQKGFSSMGDTVRESLQTMGALQKYAAQGFTQVVVRNPETNARRVLKI